MKDGLPLLQEFDFEIKYKPASQMLVPDALSRCHPFSYVGEMDSPGDEDVDFPYVSEAVKPITLPTGEALSSLFQRHNSEELHNISVVQSIPVLELDLDDGYDADNEDNQELSGVLDSFRHMLCVMTMNKDTDNENVSCEDTISSNNDTVSRTLYDLTTDLDGTYPDGLSEPMLPTLPISKNVLCVYDISSDMDTKSNCAYDLSTDIDSCRLHCDSNLLDAPIDIGGLPTRLIADKGDTVADCVSGSETHSVECVKTPITSSENVSDHIPHIDESGTLLGEGMSELFKLQRDHSYFADIIDFLVHRSLSDSQKESRRIILESADYAVFNSLLYHSRNTKSKRTKVIPPLPVSCAKISHHHSTSQLP